MTKRIHVITPAVLHVPGGAEAFSEFDREGIRVTHEVIETGPQSIESEFDEVMCAPDTLARAIRAEKDGADALVINCLGDPAVKPARELVSIPVIGPGETSLHWAAMLAGPFAVVTVLDSVVPMLENNARVFGVQDKMKSIRVVNIPVLELEKDMERLHRALSEQSIKAVREDKVRGIVLGCTGMIGCADAIEKALQKEFGAYIPVIDPVPAAIEQAIAYVNRGLSNSKLTYGNPPAKELKGMDFPERPRPAVAAE